MRLVVVGNHSLDTLAQWVTSKFSGIKSKGNTRPTFDCHPIGKAQLGKLIHYKTVCEKYELKLQFPLPELKPTYGEKPIAYINSLFDHKESGSIYSVLSKSGWATAINGGSSGESIDGFGYYNIDISATPEGLKNYEAIVGIVFGYIKMLVESGPQECRDVTNMLHLPGRNMFLPENLSVTKPTTLADPPALEPSLIRKTDKFEAWFKQDDQFFTPHGHIGLTISSESVDNSPVNYLRSVLFFTLVSAELQEQLYGALMANSKFSIAYEAGSIIVSVSGFNSELPLLLTTVLQKLKAFKVNSQKFSIYLAEVERAIQSRRQDNPHRLLRNQLDAITLAPAFDQDMLEDALKYITLDELQAHIELLFGKAYVKMLVTGNYDQSVALEATNQVLDALQLQPVPRSLINTHRSLNIEPGYFVQNVPISDEKLQELTEEEFESSVQSLISLKKEKLKSIDEEFDRLWAHIKSNKYKFDALCEDVEHLEQLNKGDLLTFWDKYINEDTAQCYTRLDMQMWSTKIWQPTAEEFEMYPSTLLALYGCLRSGGYTSLSIADVQSFVSSAVASGSIESPLAELSKLYWSKQATSVPSEVTEVSATAAPDEEETNVDFENSSKIATALQMAISSANEVPKFATLSKTNFANIDMKQSPEGIWLINDYTQFKSTQGLNGLPVPVHKFVPIISESALAEVSRHTETTTDKPHPVTVEPANTNVSSSNAYGVLVGRLRLWRQAWKKGDQSTATSSSKTPTVTPAKGLAPEQPQWLKYSLAWQEPFAYEAKVYASLSQIIPNNASFFETAQLLWHIEPQQLTSRYPVFRSKVNVHIPSQLRSSPNSGHGLYAHMFVQKAGRFNPHPDITDPYLVSSRIPLVHWSNSASKLMDTESPVEPTESPVEPTEELLGVNSASWAIVLENHSYSWFAIPPYLQVTHGYSNTGTYNPALLPNTFTKGQPDEKPLVALKGKQLTADVYQSTIEVKLELSGIRQGWISAKNGLTNFLAPKSPIVIETVVPDPTNSMESRTYSYTDWVEGDALVSHDVVHRLSVPALIYAVMCVGLFFTLAPAFIRLVVRLWSTDIFRWIGASRAMVTIALIASALNAIWCVLESDISWILFQPEIVVVVFLAAKLDDMAFAPWLALSRLFSKIFRRKPSPVLARSSSAQLLVLAAESKDESNSADTSATSNPYFRRPESVIAIRRGVDDIAMRWINLLTLPVIAMVALYLLVDQQIEFWSLEFLKGTMAWSSQVFYCAAWVPQIVVNYKTKSGSLTPVTFNLIDLASSVLGTIFGYLTGSNRAG
ncbi:metalloprotease, partial [Coemansia furcata]